MDDYIKNTEVDHTAVSKLIPLVMNALYNEEASRDITFNEIRDAFRLKQIQSKSWLLEQFKKNSDRLSDNILVIGSWIGFTSLCLFHLGYRNITEVDPDTRLEQFSNHLNRFNESFKHESIDINELKSFNFDIIINTSCEHILNNSWFEQIKNKTLIILQSNNLPGYDHVNICEDLEHMKQKYPMDYLYSGTLDFGDYKRFMLIGRKP